MSAGRTAVLAASAVAAIAGVPAKASAAKAVTPAAGSPAANRRVKLMRSIRSVAIGPFSVRGSLTTMSGFAANRARRVNWAPRRTGDYARDGTARRPWTRTGD